ncbi:MAG: 16S rRNA (adenine(1518)-N(6)/adenine(1519)-N(6))-dimethyltransferase RsmA [Patescibacteria group bacterium]|jgi:16S rRNA (adenine1518-N6/adenine1519-N6)-dimethyltransferase
MRAKKSFGQNFLTDKNIVRKIVEAAGVKAGDLILEIGPGRGSLTTALLEAGAKVVAVEADKDLIEPLQRILPLLTKERDGVRLVYGDILSDEVWKELRRVINKDYSVVANIPYNITSPILEKLFTVKPRPKRLTLMVQREVADRLLAVPPKTSVLSIACQLYAEGKKMMQVKRGAFNPPPKVDSTVVRLDLRTERLGGIDPEEVLKIVKAGFSSRRKQLHGNLAKTKVCSSEKAKETLKKIALDEKSRAENLTPNDWLKLFSLLFKK